jgi:hypothetical protein
VPIGFVSSVAAVVMWLPLDHDVTAEKKLFCALFCFSKAAHNPIFRLYVPPFSIFVFPGASSLSLNHSQQHSTQFQIM